MLCADSAELRNNCITVFGMMRHSSAQSPEFWKHEFEGAAVLHGDKAFYRTQPPIFDHAALDVCQGEAASDISQ